MRLGPGDTIVGDLAERWEVDETGAVWTFHLRPDAVWQDGTPITAGDVTFTIAALSDPAYTGPAGASWRGVHATAEDATTVRFELATPIGGFLQAATQPIAPAHLLDTLPAEALADDLFGQQPVGSGPFKLAALESERARLEAWAPSVDPSATGGGSVNGLAGEAGGGQPLPYLPGIELRFFADLDALEAAWLAGELDAVSGLNPVDLADLAARSTGAAVARYPGATLLAVVPNLRSDRPALREAAVRLALLEAIDRPRLLADDVGGLGVVADAPIPPSSWAFDPAASPRVEADAAAAKAALTAAGWTAGDGTWTPKGAKEPLTFVMVGPQRDINPVAYAAAETVALDWRAIGLSVDHLELGATELSERLRSGDFDVAVISIGIGLDPDLYPLLASSQTTGARTNVVGVQDPALDSLLVAARAPGTMEARKAAYTALQVRLASSMYLLPLVFRDESALVSNVLSGRVSRPIGDAGGRFWDVLTWRLADDR